MRPPIAVRAVSPAPARLAQRALRLWFVPVAPTAATSSSLRALRSLSWTREVDRNISSRPPSCKHSFGSQASATHRARSAPPKASTHDSPPTSPSDASPRSRLSRRASASSQQNVAAQILRSRHSCALFTPASLCIGVAVTCSSLDRVFFPPQLTIASHERTPVLTCPQESLPVETGVLS